MKENLILKQSKTIPQSAFRLTAPFTQGSLKKLSHFVKHREFYKNKNAPHPIRTWEHAVPPDFASTPKRRADAHSTPITVEPVADYTRNKTSLPFPDTTPK